MDDATLRRRVESAGRSGGGEALDAKGGAEGEARNGWMRLMCCGQRRKCLSCLRQMAWTGSWIAVGGIRTSDDLYERWVGGNWGRALRWNSLSARRGGGVCG